MSNVHQHVHTTTYSPFSYLLESPIPAVLTHGASGTTVRGSHPPKKRGVGEGGKGRGGGKGGEGKGGREGGGREGGEGRGGKGRGGGKGGGREGGGKGRGGAQKMFFK